jgi:hypothetical protein
VQRLDLRPVDQAVAAALGEVEGVHRQGADDQVPAGQPGGAQEPLQPLAGLPGQGPATEQVVVGGLVGQDEQAQVAEPAPVDRPDPERRVRGDPEGGEVGPAEAGLGAEQQPGQAAGGPGSKAVAAARGGSYGRSPASSS